MCKLLEDMRNEVAEKVRKQVTKEVTEQVTKEVTKEVGVQTYIETCKEFGITDNEKLLEKLLIKFDFLTEEQANAYLAK